MLYDADGTGCLALFPYFYIIVDTLLLMLIYFSYIIIFFFILFLLLYDAEKRLGEIFLLICMHAGVAPFLLLC